jgi:hypothetical protein
MTWWIRDSIIEIFVPDLSNLCEEALKYLKENKKLDEKEEGRLGVSIY